MRKCNDRECPDVRRLRRTFFTVLFLLVYVACAAGVAVYRAGHVLPNCTPTFGRVYVGSVLGIGGVIGVLVMCTLAFGFTWVGERKKLASCQE